MKKMLMLALVAVSMLVVSCGKDKEESIVGTWYFESSSTDGVVINFNDCQKKSHLIFTDKTYEMISYNDENGKCEQDEKEEGTYTISGNQLIVKFNDGKTDIAPFSISGKTLVITYKQSENGEEYTFDLTLKKR